MRRALLLGLALALAPPLPLAGQAPPRCADATGDPERPDPDLYCIDLLSTPRAEGAWGMAELGRVPSPFGVAVSPEGHHRFDLSLRVGGLPDPASLGGSTYVAWATTPLLRPMVRLGEVRDGRTPPARVEMDKFLVLVSAEADAGGEEPRGPLVLRGMSASTRMQPHELAWMLAATLGGDEEHAHHAREDGWVTPPMHPQVSMPPELMRLRPSVSPWLPDSSGLAAVPLAVPRRLVRAGDGDTIRLEAGRVKRRLFGRELLMYGFNGQYPGPLIRVDQGATIVVDFVNRTELPTAVHWHGVRLDNRFDGVPHVTQEPVEPGGSFRYEVRFPDAGIYWYHPHHREDIAQDLGLYGNLLVDSGRPGYYAPAHREEVLMLDDLLVSEEGGLVPYGREVATHALMGRFGNVLLVNGEPRHDLRVRRGEVVRFFLTNVASTRTFNLSFGGAPIKLVASDLGRYEREEWVESVVISPAERYVVDVRFEEPGEVALTNRVRAIDRLYGSFFSEVDTLGVVRVDGEAAEPDLAGSFRRLRENAEVAAELDRFRARFDDPPERELVLDLEVKELPFPLGPMMRMDSAYFNPVEWSGTMPEMDWVATSRDARWILRDPATGRENQAVDWRFRLGETVRIRLVNRRGVLHAMQHPIHIHGQRFLVLSQDGVPNDNLVWKDTVLLPVGGTAELLLELSNPGRWMLHCHIAEHLETGMKMLFDVAPSPGPSPHGAGGSDTNP